MIWVLTIVVAATAFDKPAKVEVVKLDVSEKLTCTYYNGWAAKEIDAGEKGAARLSFVRYSIPTSRPPCVKAAAANEKILDDWSGYFIGAVGDLAVFSSDDGWNGGEGFAIYDTSSGRKVFSDVAVGDLKIEARTIAYKRVVALDCLALTDTKCIEKARETAATTADIGAVCKSGYSNWLIGFDNAIKDCDAACKEARKKQHESFWRAPSVLAYGVSVDRTTFVMSPGKGSKVECWPAN
jgi:hypothetical protein